MVREPPCSFSSAQRNLLDCVSSNNTVCPRLLATCLAGSTAVVENHTSIIFKACRAYSARLKGCRMGRSDKVSLWYVALLINTRFRFLF